jgi:hypothetical protein
MWTLRRSVITNAQIGCVDVYHIGLYLIAGRRKMPLLLTHNWRLRHTNSLKIIPMALTCVRAVFHRYYQEEATWTPSSHIFAIYVRPGVYSTAVRWQKCFNMGLLRDDWNQLHRNAGLLLITWCLINMSTGRIQVGELQFSQRCLLLHLYWRWRRGFCPKGWQTFTRRHGGINAVFSCTFWN